MKYAKLSHLDGGQFRRLTGVKRATFEKMPGILEAAHARKKARGGRPNAVPVQDMLLMAPEYLREYRTCFHVGTNYGLSESAAYTAIRRAEDMPVKDGAFSLPGRKELLKGDAGIEAVLADATESPVQRPNKNSAGITPARRSGTR